MQLQNNTQEFKELAKQKRIKNITEQKALVRKISSLLAYNDFTEKVKQHADYVGQDNKASTSPKGFVIQFNKFVKKLFGKTVEGITEVKELETLTVLRNRAVDIVSQGESKKLSRKKIKQEMYRKLQQIFDVLELKNE